MFVWLIIAVLSNAYFVALQIASPASFFSVIFDFSILWFYISVFSFVMFLMRKRHLVTKFWHWAKTWLKVILISFASLFFVFASVSLFLMTHPRLATDDENAKYVILLGGGITKDAKVTKSVMERVKTAANYLMNYENAVVVVSGGKGQFLPCDEASVLKRTLIELGIAENRILLENQALDTIQNFKYSVKVLSEYENCTENEILSNPVIIVTSDFHIRRSEALAYSIGFKNVYGLSAKTPLLFVPNAYAREVCSYAKLLLRIFIFRRI